MDAFAAQAAASIEKRWLLQAMPPPLIVPKGHTPLGALVSSSTAADVLDAPLASPLARAALPPARAVASSSVVTASEYSPSMISPSNVSRARVVVVVDRPRARARR